METRNFVAVDFDDTGAYQRMLNRSGKSYKWSNITEVLFTYQTYS